jgi:hypothetical protein
VTGSFGNPLLHSGKLQCCIFENKADCGRSAREISHI